MFFEISNPIILNYELILKTLTDAGYVKLLQSTENAILWLDSAKLKVLGLPSEEDKDLYIIRKEKELLVYEIDFSQYWDYGDRGAVYVGKNLKTGEKVAIKRLGGNRKEVPIGWKLAYQRLNQHPQFVTTFAFGICYTPQDLNGVLSIQPCGKAVQVMEFVEQKLTNLLHVKKERSHDQVFAFVKDLMSAYVNLHKEGLYEFDATDGNVLVHKDFRPKLCDFDELKERVSPSSSGRPSYVFAVNALPYLYSWYSADTEDQRAAVLAKDTIIEELRGWLYNMPSDANVSFEEIIIKLEKTIQVCEAQQQIYFANHNQTGFTPRYG
jgi:serine/threonine protein kinase